MREVSFITAMDIFELGDIISNLSNPFESWMVYRRVGTTHYVWLIDILGKQFDISGKNPILWFIERMK